MAIQVPFEFDYESDTFPPETKLLSVADPVEDAPGDTTYYFARWLQLEEGMYRMRSLVDDAATWWLGVGQYGQRMIASNTLAEGVVEWDFYHPGGKMRLDVILQNLPVQPTPCYFIYAIYRGEELVESSFAPPWVFDTSPVADSDLPPLDGGKQFVWTLLPNWKYGITERLAWHTDVMESESGAEQRRAVRAHPRRSIEASFLRQGADRTRMDMFFTAIGHRTFLVPLWFEQIKMLEGIRVGATGVVFVDSTTRDREFREGDYVFVNAGDPNDYDLLQVGDVEEERFSWATPPHRAWPPGTRIYPCREARFIDMPKLVNRTETVGTAQVRFELVQPDVRQGSFGNPQNTIPLFRFTPDRSTLIDLDYDRKAYMLDNESSIVQFRDVGGDGRAIMKLGMRLFGRSQVASFRRFIAAARGRAVAFYSPTFTQDLTLLADVAEGQEYIDAEPVGFYAAMDRPQPTRLMLRIDYDYDLVMYCTIVNIEPRYDLDGNLAAERFHLKEEMPKIDRKTVRRISFITPCRFDQDSFELHHHTANMRAVDTTVVIRHLYDRRDVS